MYVLLVQDVLVSRQLFATDIIRIFSVCSSAKLLIVSV